MYYTNLFFWTGQKNDQSFIKTWLTAWRKVERKLTQRSLSPHHRILRMLYNFFIPGRRGRRIKKQNTQSPLADFSVVQPLGELSKQIFGQSWEFGPTGLTPAPLPEGWDFFREFFGNFSQKTGQICHKNSDL